MHTITSNPLHGYIEVKIKGWCTLEEFDQFVLDLRAAIAAFPDIGRPSATFYDFTDASIQTQEVVAKMKALAENPALADRRVALYSGGVLARLQAKRISQNRDNMRVFDDRSEAIAWLKSPPVETAHLQRRTG